MRIQIRKALPEDIEGLYSLIQSYADKGIMLPRSKSLLERQLADFTVALADGELVGCGSLCMLGKDLVEIRSLGLLEDFKGKGIGKKLVDQLVGEARQKEIPKIMALTYETGFFERNGFEVVDKAIFPEKVWTDCVHCPKQDCCDEIAVMKRLDNARD